MKQLNLLNPAVLLKATSDSIKQKGEQFNTVQLRVSKDYPWQILNALVSDLETIALPEDLRRVRSIITERSVKKLGQLADDWSPQCISPSAEIKDLTHVRSRLMLVSLLKKFPFPEGSDNSRTMSALKKFIKAEISCRNYNVSGYKNFSHGEQIHVKAIFSLAREWIQKVIGIELPDKQKLTLRSRHGPGATTSTINGNTSSYFKYSEWPYDVTSACREFAIATIQSDVRWMGALEDDYRRKMGIPTYSILNWTTFWDQVLNLVPGNKIAFVPKSFETHRTIAIEPTLNLYLQLGVDGYIRNRLKAWLIDLDDQARNQRFAGWGSIYSNFSTLDLSSASDTVALRLVRELLPPAWYDYLVALRSPRGSCRVPGVIDRVFTYEKISSMGNGYTFALESLVFAAIVHAVIKYKSGKYLPSKVAVYGDDIIVPTEYTDDVINFLQRAGFALNLDKSFTSGPFRESCGADWFLGQPVRAVYLKEYPTSVKNLFNDYNRITRNFFLFFDERKPKNIQQLFEKLIPSHLKIYGPCSDTEFDTYIHSSSSLRGYWYQGEFLFWRLITRTERFHGKKVGSFHFRKLMKSLLAGENIYSNTPWLTGTVTSGQAFEVVRPKAEFLAIIRSAADFWQSTYSRDLQL